MTDYLNRKYVTAYPNGAVEPKDRSGGRDLVPGWSPPGWKPEGDYVKILGTSEFMWPTTNRLYRSRSTAKKRAQLSRIFQRNGGSREILQDHLAQTGCGRPPPRTTMKPAPGSKYR